MFYLNFFFEREKTKHLKLYKQLQVYKNLPIVSIQSDHGREFDKKKFINFYNDFGISNNFLARRTP